MLSSSWLLFISTLCVLFPQLFAKKACRDLLACVIEKGCINLPWLIQRAQNAEISAQLYNDIDSAIDYGCIFTSGCPAQCTSCSLCHNSRLRVMKVLAGIDPNVGSQCGELLECAKKCVASTSSSIATVGQCLRQRCAFHCFNGSCPKCNAFVTKVFNQMCVSGELRDRVKGFKGQCSDLIREVVHTKFRKEFDNYSPSIRR
ncbi:hypothetical protein KIN20_037959 [Parelaphostrongylus tenuis]|uniref:Uncharacterized protein n=1 Tax=Parelaphostrongylus tenuis TaxID=148309 RepID=A0AAD5WLG4_PARTN|nr:hypothetical protein KIN20_037959 [Parelaphostrongylus tenuis]